MSVAKSQMPGGVAETLFIPRYLRAMESKRSDALITDKNAETLIRTMRVYHFQLGSIA